MVVDWFGLDSPLSSGWWTGAGGLQWNLSYSRWASMSASPVLSISMDRHFSTSASFPSCCHSSMDMAASADVDGGCRRDVMMADITMFTLILQSDW